MNYKELLAIRRKIQLLKDSRGDYVVSTITELEPLLELFQSLLKQAELRARADELKKLQKTGEQYGWGETFATDFSKLINRIATLEAEMENLS